MNQDSTDILVSAGEKGEIILYQPNESIKLEVRVENETVWLTQAQMAELFDVKENTITYHIKEIYKCNELDADSTARKIRVVRREGTRNVNRQIDFYNLDMILSVGYRVNSVRGIMFRRWSTEILKECLLRGHSVYQHLVALQGHIDNRLVKIEDKLLEHQQQIDFFIQREQPITEQLFSTGCVWDAYTFVSGLVRSATERLILIDPYVDERTLLLLDKRAAEVECTVYTRYSEQTELDFQKHNQQCVPIRKIQLPQAVHDRYLIVDNQVWLLGASVKDMGRGLCTVIRLGFTSEDVLERIIY